MDEREINRRVQKLRKEKGYTQAELARLLGLKTSTYSQMEQHGNITANMVIRLAEIFNVDTDIILFGEIKQAGKPNIEELMKVLPYQINSYYFIMKVNNDERNMLTSFRNISKKRQEMVMRFVYDLVMNRRSKEIPKLVIPEE